jgi:hypothetical protein
MLKNSIDHIVADKLEGINFDFKSEYWNKMQEELDANCAQTNTCSSTSIGGFLSGSLITTFVAVISIILFFPWAIDQTPVSNTICDEDNVQNTELIADSNSGQAIINDNIEVIVPEKVEAEAKVEVNVKKSKASVSNKKKHRRKIKVTTKSKVTPITKPSNEKQQITNQKVKPIENTSEEVIEKQTIESSTDSAEKAPVEITKPKQEDVVTNETDSIYIPDAKLLGNDKEDVDKKTTVDVDAGPKPVKHVKTKSKPIKRVFKKRKGILYRLGLRK